MLAAFGPAGQPPLGLVRRRAASARIPIRRARQPEVVMKGGSFQVSVERGVPARMRDGTTLYADVYRPLGDGPFPVVLMRTPYDRTDGGSISYVHPSWYARHGFIVAIQDCR